VVLANVVAELEVLGAPDFQEVHPETNHEELANLLLD